MKRDMGYPMRDGRGFVHRIYWCLNTVRTIHHNWGSRVPAIQVAVEATGINTIHTKSMYGEWEEVKGWVLDTMTSERGHGSQEFWTKPPKLQIRNSACWSKGEDRGVTWVWKPLGVFINISVASLLAHMVYNLPVMQETRVQSLSQEDPWKRKWQLTSVFLPREFHGQRSLVGYSSWGL